ncbi:MAG: MFS transporter, partial [Methylococcales bacterium]|nr:MFS transporter [Methylococcales bacterium]
IGAIIALVIANAALSQFYNQLGFLIGFLWLFFCGFNLLEATLPSLISKTAPADLKGTAMGAYSSSQFMGAFVGGVTGGWLYGEYGAEVVFIFTAVAASSWVFMALFMRTPRYLANLLISINEITPDQSKQFVEDLLAIEGIAEARLHFDDNTAYLKVDNDLLNKNHLQALLIRWST